MCVTRSTESPQVLVGPVHTRRWDQTLARSRTGTWFGGLRLRLSAASQGAALDRLLAEGVDPQASAVLALRARRLTGPRSRKRVADGLAGAIRRATVTRPGITAAVCPDAHGLLDARIVLHAVEHRLRGSEPVTARGVAMLALLLTDGASPLYRQSRPGELASRLRAVAAALAPRLTPPERDASGYEQPIPVTSSLDARTTPGGGPAAATAHSTSLPQAGSSLAGQESVGHEGAGR